MSKIVKPFVFALCLLPLALLLWNGFHNSLGANPIEKITHFTGDWALQFLLLTLAITPARKLFGWSVLVRYRRMLGLYAFFYACLHFLTYFVLDQFFDFREIAADILKRPYITVGFVAFVLLIPLAVTSTNKMIRRLGRHWKQLHQLVYVVAVLVILHFLWLVKADTFEPLMYAFLLLALFFVRLWYQNQDKHKQRLPKKSAVEPSP